MIGRLEGYTGDGFKERKAYINNQNDLLRKQLMEQRAKQKDLKNKNDNLDLKKSLEGLPLDKTLENNDGLNIFNSTINNNGFNSSNTINNDVNPLFQTNNYKMNNDIK